MNNIRGMLEIRWCSREESACQCRRRKRHGFYSWVRDDPPEKEMATHSSILARRIPRTKEPGGLQSMGSQRVGHAHTHTIRECYLCILWECREKGVRIYLKICSQFTNHWQGNRWSSSLAELGSYCLPLAGGGGGGSELLQRWRPCPRPPS